MEKHAFVICAYGSSKYLEECVLSLLNQTKKSKVVIATSTVTNLIREVADKYRLELFVREGNSEIQEDWNYACRQLDVEWVTLAHQDDVYHPKYAEYILRAINKYQDGIIAFSDYTSLIDGKKVRNINCKLRRLLRSPMKIPFLADKTICKTAILSLGNCICCPSVTYRKAVVKGDIFTSKLHFSLDWDTYLKFAKGKGRFIYVDKPLTYYRIHKDATTQKFIDENKRETEDFYMFRQFWPDSIAKVILYFYRNAYKAYGKNDEYRLASNDKEFIERELYARVNRNKIIRTLSCDADPKVQEMAMFIKKYGISVFPYKFTLDYKIKDITLKKDSNRGLYYVITDKKSKIYMKAEYKSKFRAKRYYKNLLLEQDERSPHRYLTNEFSIDEGSVVFDIGAAEGFLCRDSMQKIKKVFLFECDEKWIEALKCTYKDYGEKVTIVPKMVTDYVDEGHTTIDAIIREYQLEDEELFIKMDAEGCERDILNGAKKLIERKKIGTKFVICTYHRQDDEERVREVFKEWHQQASEGYMLYYYDFSLRKPYIRRGVVRVWL